MCSVFIVNIEYIINRKVLQNYKKLFKFKIPPLMQLYYVFVMKKEKKTFHCNVGGFYSAL